MTIVTDIAKQLELGEDDRVRDLVEQGLSEGTPPRDLLEQGLLAGMAVVGEQFRQREIFLPDVLLAARAMYAGLGLLEPRLAGAGLPSAAAIVIGSVKGDLHDIGKNLVGIMLRGAGFRVVDLGNDVPPARFVDEAVAAGATVIGMSALLTTTMPVMRDVVALVRDRGLAPSIRTIVGGAPVSADFAREIGADAYAFDAASAVDRVRALVAAG